jgi:hypothetical protein
MQNAPSHFWKEDAGAFVCRAFLYANLLSDSIGPMANGLQLQTWDIFETLVVVKAEKEVDVDHIAGHLRRELKLSNEIPAASGKCLSRTVIADIAMTLVEATERGRYWANRHGVTAPNLAPNLLLLLRDLTGAERHRKALADKPSDAFMRAVEIEAERALEGQSIGVRDLAKAVSVSAATVSGWRSSDDYQQAVTQAKKFISECRSQALSATSLLPVWLSLRSFFRTVPSFGVLTALCVFHSAKIARSLRTEVC